MENMIDTSSGSSFVPVEPFEIIVFGGTGDLARRKLLPALYHRYCDGQISDDSRIIGVSRSDYTRSEYHDLITKCYHEFSDDVSFDQNLWSKFLELVYYVKIDVIDNDNWKVLENNLSSSNELIRIFYLAMPPSMFSKICVKLDKVGLVNEKSRVVLEKPLGTDYESALKINEGVGQVFDENNTYRIDHYLGKETVQNLLVLRFGNILLEPLWSNQAIDYVQITAAESIGVEGRGAYYDNAGALRDMVQNHLLQLLCLTAMEAPASLEADDVRAEKIKVLKALKHITLEDVNQNTVRGQYIGGNKENNIFSDYLTDVGSKDSSTETYVAIKAEIENWRWAGVPIYLRTGKRMSSRRSEIVIQFKPVPHSIFGDTPVKPNKLVIRLQPDEAVKLWFEVKEPGAGGMRLKTLPLNLSYADNFTVRYPDAYERLLMDVVRGNLSLFMCRGEVESAWQWVDGILNAWRLSDTSIDKYNAGTEGPDKANDMLSKSNHLWS